MKHKTIPQLKTDLAYNLKRMRTEKGLAQEQLALEADVNRTVVRKIECGVTSPSLDILLRLVNRLAVGLADLLVVRRRRSLQILI